MKEIKKERGEKERGREGEKEGEEEKEKKRERTGNERSQQSDSHEEFGQDMPNLKNRTSLDNIFLQGETFRFLLQKGKKEIVKEERTNKKNESENRRREVHRNLVGHLGRMPRDTGVA